MTQLLFTILYCKTTNDDDDEDSKETGNRERGQTTNEFTENSKY